VNVVMVFCVVRHLAFTSGGLCLYNGFMGCNAVCVQIMVLWGATPSLLITGTRHPARSCIRRQHAALNRRYPQ
jgi:hypothetical protein